VGRESERRKLTLTPELAGWLRKPVASENLTKVKAEARVHLGQFVKGEKIDDLDFMKRVEDRRVRPPSFGHEVWSIRPRVEQPQHRYFGVFISQDWFLVCTKQERKKLEESENRWHAEIDKTLRVFAHFYGASRLPHSGTQLRDYISSNAEHRDDRW
jgi:hypothetical protein